MAPKCVYHRDRAEIDTEFYTLYDPQFLLSKAATLMAALHDPELTKKRLEEMDFGGIGAQADDEYFAALSAELHFTELHEMESFFALLLSPYQSLPHWIYLTVYETRDIQTQVDNLVRGDIEAATGGIHSDVRPFICAAMYGQYPTGIDGAPDEGWSETFDNAYFLIRLIGERYQRGKDTYNAYKHGLRVISGAGPSSISIRLESPSDEESPGETMIMEHSLIELQKEKFQGNWRFHEAVRSFDPMASFFFISAMHQMLMSMQKSRLGRLRGENQVWGLSQFRKLDRARAQSLAMTDRTSWRFTL